MKILKLSRAVHTCAVLLAIAGCGGLSDVGEQEGEAASPNAVITVIGQPSRVNGNTVSATVRSGSEVLVSGKDSEDAAAPILTFEWERRSTNASALKIVERNSSTIGFQVPQVTTATRYDLRLTVRDAKGGTDSQDFELTVVPVADPNQFLSYLDVPTTFEVVAVTSQDLPPCMTPQQLNCLRFDTPFTIIVEAQAQYWDIAGQFNQGPTGVVLDTKSYSGTWSRLLGASDDCTATENPRFTVPIPSFDTDDIAAAVQSNSPVRIADASRIDDARILITITISQPAGAAPLPVGEQQVCVPSIEAASSNAAVAPGPRIEFTSDQLSASLVSVQQGPNGAQPVVQDTKETAEAYYATIDTAEDVARKATFVGWLKVNGFLPASHGNQIDWAVLAAGSDSHATYVNNFDLGFGRDMYTRKLRCSHAGPSYQPGDCDVASVVVNYGSLEAAAKKLGPQLAVAMEYSRTGTTGPRFVKFYTYAPDIRCEPASGCSQFRRVLSANLDGRGEKYMPGTCTICHGGTPLGLSAQDRTRYASRHPDAAPGDVNAAFLPWDLKSFLFSDDAQAGFPDDAANTSHHQAWLDARRATQAPRIKGQNQLALLTYADPVDQANRYALPRQLVQGWYSRPNGEFFDGFVPEQWNANSEQSDLYLNVFAQYCRTCHVSHVPSPAGVGVAGLDPFATCNSTGVLYSSNNRQIAFGCYQQFINAERLTERLRGGAMPAARLTMDRFWVAEGTPAAEVLSRHINLPVADIRPTLIPRLDGIEQRDPISGTTIPKAFVGSFVEVNRDSQVRLIGSSNFAADRYDWLVREPDGTAVTLIGAEGKSPVFVASRAVQYQVQFGVNGGTSVSASVVVPNWVPVAINDTASVAPDAQRPIAIRSNDGVRRAGTSDNLNALDSGDLPHVTRLCVSPGDAICNQPSTITTSRGGIVLVAANGDVTYQISALSLTACAAAQGTPSCLDAFSYQLVDRDGDISAKGDVTVTARTALNASDTQCVNVLSGSGVTSFTPNVQGGIQPYGAPTFDANGGTAGTISGTTAPFQFAPQSTTYTGTVVRNYVISDASGGAPEPGRITFGVFPRAPWTAPLGSFDPSQSTAIDSLWMVARPRLDVAMVSQPCTACHGSSSPSGGLRLAGTSTEVYNCLTGTPPLPSGCSLPSSGPARINTANPTQSLLLTCPTSGLGCRNTHTAKFFANTMNSEYQQILRWIQEGASQSSSNSFRCP